MKIYFDHSASTPVDKKVMSAMLPYFSDAFGNPSSIHGFGQIALAAVDKAREQAAKFLNCSPEEIIFTSGATESDNLTIFGLIKSLKEKRIRRAAANSANANSQNRKPHIITTLIEHDAVLEPFLELEKQGVEVTFLTVKPNGVVDMEKFKKAIKANTVLVSVMYVNSEVGSVQPIRDIGKHIYKLNIKRLRDWQKGRPKERGGKPDPIYFHTDAVQGVNFFNCDVKWNYIDMLSLSGHKIYGPKGVGALYVKKGVPLEAVQKGGHHERNLRSGTLNVPGIVGLGAALDQIGRGEKGDPSLAQAKNNKKIEKLRDMLVAGIQKKIPDVVLNTDRVNATPSHAHFSFLGVEGESILIALDLEGVAVSTGSACASGSLKASHVLLAMGIKKEVAHNSVRFTLGKHNKETDIKRLLEVLPPIIARLRKMNPIYKK
jgi:cysteine desulfurase